MATHLWPLPKRDLHEFRQYFLRGAWSRPGEYSAKNYEQYHSVEYKFLLEAEADRQRFCHMSLHCG